MPRFFAVVLAAAGALAAQGSATDYERAAGLRQRFAGKLVRFTRTIHWLDDDRGVWWPEGEGDDRTFTRIDDNGKRRTGKAAEAIGLPTGPVQLQPLASWDRSSRSDTRTTIHFENEFDRRVRLYWVRTNGELQQYGEIAPRSTREMSTFVGHVFVLDFAADDLAGIFRATERAAVAKVGEASRAAAMGGRTEPPRKRAESERSLRLEISDDNVILHRKRGGPSRLTTDGSTADSHTGPFTYSPNGRFAAGWQRTHPKPRQIPITDVAPVKPAATTNPGLAYDAVQPRTRFHNYRKPGDPLPQRRPRLFDLKRGLAIPMRDSAFRDTYRVSDPHWAPDSNACYFLCNKRGHQRLTLYRVDCSTRELKAIVDERSKTFVDYSQKTFLHWLETGAFEKSPQLLWTSERDGNNHLYRVDATTGDIVNQVTSGDWRVRRVLHVDLEAQEIWLIALGLAKGQSPYHEHLARVKFDGTQLTLLTAGDGTHRVKLNDDRTLFVDRWSRVDQPTVTELRDARTGKRIAELGRDDATRLLAAGYTMPERFVAKGRDGKTDIHGIIIRPSNFEKGREYPVLDDIYSGPHDHHVPVRFGMHHRQRQLAELGFVVVRIDGMGTNWRSKAFHDVCWQNLMDGGIPDHVAWLRAAAKQFPELDLERVGIFGGSAGGQNAMAAMLTHPKFFTAAVADCGCHDNRMDKLWWNEAWMGAMGPHYAQNSNVTHAHRLQGKLMLTLGGKDTNVDPASTLQVVDALVKAGKDFDFVIDPSGGHGIGESRYMARRRQDFFVRHLLAREPRW
ncbi:MAG: prolyl oligopeptidase family serine peptidase [bacterium]|nr:prolyl oligopeptidase family serine peptidase [bacterium]